MYLAVNFSRVADADLSNCSNGSGADELHSVLSVLNKFPNFSKTFDIKEKQVT